MNQSLAVDISGFMAQAVATGLFTARCTIQAPDGVIGTSGAPSGTYANVSGLVNIQCMNAPDNFGASLSASEGRSLPEIASRSLRHVLLDRYYDELSPETNWGNVGWRAVITTALGEVQTYDLKGAEADSQEVMTRLCLETVTV